MSKKKYLMPVRKIHGRIHEYLLNRKKNRSEYNTIIRPLKQELTKRPNLAILTLTPEHGNMGDQAIALAEQVFLDKLNLPYIEVSGRVMDIIIQHRSCHIFNNHPILVTGGGYLGTIWYGAEASVRTIIQNNPDSCIILLPNTIYYEDSDFGLSELKKSLEIYNSHKNLHLFARERISYNQMKNLYNNVSLAPDMVLSLNQTQPCANRSGCILCLRADKEKTRSEEDDSIILQQMIQLFGSNIQHTDMIEGDFISIAERKAALDKKFSEFRQAELVITDRLHGMIFCAITGTPCIAIESKSHKLRGCYNDWLKAFPYISLISDPRNILSAYKSLGVSQKAFSVPILSSEFDKLGQHILSLFKKEI